MSPSKSQSTLLLVAGAVLLISMPVLAGNETKDSEKARKEREAGQKIIDSVKTPGMKIVNQIPKNFPVPPYPRNVSSQRFIHSTQGNPSASAQIVTSDSSEIVYHWYKKVLEQGRWQVRPPQENTGTTAMKYYSLEGSKGHNWVTINVFAVPGGKESNTSISINWVFRKK